MKQLTTLLTLALTLFTLHSKAQHQHTEKCGHTLILQSMETQYPGFLEAVNKTFEAAKIKGQQSRLNGRAEIYTVPIVVHVVWNSSEPSQNIADSIIEDQIKVLNEDYRRLNTDANNIRDEFLDVVGDTEIEFELKRIIRVSTTELFEPSATGLDDADQVKSSSNGGSDAIDVNSNLNIWICKLQPITILGIPLGEVLGYAYPPAGLSHWPDGSNAPTPGKDGVVLDYRTIGRNNPNASHFTDQGFTIIGRTATHEVGHYLGLRHIWGDAIAFLGEDGCEVDDGVEDTPNAAGSNQANGCNAATNSCESGMPDDLPDMWENYMDYSKEDCQNSFTQGQIDILRGVLEGPRSGLLVEDTSSCSAPVTGTISGNGNAITSTTEAYAVSNTGNSYTWSVTGGTIASGQGSNAIQVTWAVGTSGQVCLIESDGDCDGNEVCFDVVLCTTPTTGAITGSISAEVTTSETYSTSSSSSEYYWEVTGGLITSGAGTNSIVVTWGNGNSGEVCLVEGDGSCLGSEVCKSVVLNTPTGIQEIAYNKSLAVYPNPAASFIKVKANEVPNKIELFDVLGSLLKSIEITQQENTIFIDNLNAKIILVKVYFEDGFSVQRIVVD